MTFLRSQTASSLAVYSMQQNHVSARLPYVRGSSSTAEWRTDNPCDRILHLLGPQHDVVTHHRALPYGEVAAAIEKARAAKPSGVGAAWVPVVLPGLGRREDRSSAGGCRGGAGACGEEQGGGRLHANRPVRAEASAHGGLVGVSGRPGNGRRDLTLSPRRARKPFRSESVTCRFTAPYAVDCEKNGCGHEGLGTRNPDWCAQCARMGDSPLCNRPFPLLPTCYQPSLPRRGADNSLSGTIPLLGTRPMELLPHPVWSGRRRDGSLDRD